ncbi:MAG: hypothetical protein RQ743_10555 [Bacteroidales bacterium]|nr:hypothetical protein [Bacteroidales bacterium]
MFRDMLDPEGEIYGRYNRNQVSQPLGYCLDIPGLDEQQKQRIMEVNDAHRKKLDELRLKRQTAASFEEMNEIGAAMLLQHNEHIKQVKALLNEEQKEYLNNTYFGMGPRGLRQAPAYGRGIFFLNVRHSSSSILCIQEG